MKLRKGTKIIEHGKPAPAARVKVPRGMNGLEKAFADYLEMYVRCGDVKMFVAQPEPLRLAHRCTYQPDFYVIWAIPALGGPGFVEVKGFERDDAIVKFKIAAEMYPQFSFRMVKRVHGEWVVTREYRDGKPVKGGNTNA